MRLHRSQHRLARASSTADKTGIRFWLKEMSTRMIQQNRLSQILLFKAWPECISITGCIQWPLQQIACDCEMRERTTGYANGTVLSWSAGRQTEKRLQNWKSRQKWPNHHERRSSIGCFLDCRKILSKTIRSLGFKLAIICLQLKLRNLQVLFVDR